MRLLYCVVATLFCCVGNVYGQATGDYRTAQAGDWNTVGIWQRFNGTSWVAAPSSPTSSDGVITILNNVNIPNGVTITADQIVVTEGLTIAAGGQLTLANGAGTDLSALSGSSIIDVSGILLRSNLTAIDNQSVASRIQFRSGSEYRHSFTTTFGDLPIATWNANSTISLVGFASNPALTADATWAQSVGHVVFNSTGQSNTVDLNGQLTDIRGNLSVLSSGTSTVQLSNSQTVTINVNGNLLISGSSRINFSTSGTLTMNIGGNWTMSSTNTTGSSVTLTGTATVNLTGDYLQNNSASRLHLSNTGTTGNGIINLSGNFSLTSGRIDENGSSPTQGTFRFIKNGMQTFVNTGTITGYINYYISPVTTLDVGTSPLVATSPGAFTLDGGTIMVGSTAAAGAIQVSYTLGNIRTNGRTYNTGSKIIYNGTATQYLGTGHPNGAGITTIIDNPNDVNMAANVLNNGVLRLVSGSYNLNNFTLTSGGTLETAGGTLKGTTTSNLIIQGTADGSWGTMVFAPSASDLASLTLNRIGTGAGVTLNSALTINSQLNLNRGDFTNTTGLTMAPNATLTRYNTAQLLGASPVVTGGNYNVIYRTFSVSGGPYANIAAGVELPADATSLGSLTITTAQTADFVTLTQPITINGTLTLSRGTLAAGAFNVTMQGPTWMDNAGNYDPGTSTIIFGGITNIAGSSNPTFNHMSLLAAGQLTLSRSVSVAGNLNFATGATFTPGANAVIFSGAVTQTVSANGATFSNVTITKTGSAGLNVTSAWNISGVFQFSGTTTNSTIQSNGFMTLVSTTDAAGAIGNGSIYRLQSGNTIAGNVTVQRYMSGEGRIYRYISVPVSGAMVSQWKDDFDIGGPIADPTPKRTVCGFQTNPASYSLFYYDETVAGLEDQGYVGYPLPGNATTSSPIVVGRGYTTFIRECSLPTIIDVTGPINNGNIALPVTYTAHAAPADDGWNLVGNPYPSTIDWDAGTWTKTRISTAISIRDNGSGVVRYYDAGISNDIPNGQIAAGQAFYVRATAASPSLIVRENTKVLVGAEFFREDVSVPEIPSFALNFSKGEQYDRAYVKVQDGAIDGLDDFDAPKLSNPEFSFSVLDKEYRRMAIHAIGKMPEAQEFKLLMQKATPGDYKITLEIRPQYFNEHSFTLYDHYLQKSISLKRSGHYAFSVTSDARSADENRFSLRVDQGASQEEVDALSGISIYPNPIKQKLSVDVMEDNVMKIQVVNVLGQVQHEINVNGEKNQYEVDFSSQKKGVYLMVISRKNSKSSIRLYKE